MCACVCVCVRGCAWVCVPGAVLYASLCPCVCGMYVCPAFLCAWCAVQPPVSPITATGAAVVAGLGAFEGAAARAKAKDHGLYAEIVKIESELEVGCATVCGLYP